MTSTQEPQDTCQKDHKYVGNVTIQRHPQNSQKYGYTYHLWIEGKVQEGLCGDRFESPGEALDAALEWIREYDYKAEYPTLNVVGCLYG